MIEIIVKPAGRGRFCAMVGGRMLVIMSRTPFLTAARVLLADGVDPATPIRMRHEGSSVIALRSTVGEAASLTVVERDDGKTAPRFRPFKEYPANNSGIAKDGDSALAGTDGARLAGKPLTGPGAKSLAEMSWEELHQVYPRE